MSNPWEQKCLRLGVCASYFLWVEQLNNVLPLKHRDNSPCSDVLFVTITQASFGAGLLFRYQNKPFLSSILYRNLSNVCYKNSAVQFRIR